MLYPLLIDPDFLIECKDDDEKLMNLKDLVLEFKSHWQDIFILIDDKNENFNKKYQDILKNYGHENPNLKIILDFIINTDNKKINLNNNIDNFVNLKNFLKMNGVKNFAEIPDYFEKKFINKKECTGDVFLTEIKYDDLIEKITSVTRFSKKIYLIDPMIPYHLTNLNDQFKFQHQNFVSNIKSRSDDTENLYVHSLDVLLKNIYESNFFKDELQIYIMTTIEPRKIDHFKWNIIEEINKWKRFKEAKLLGENQFEYKKKKYSSINVNGKIISLLNKKDDENDEDFNNRILKGNCLDVINEHEIKKEVENWESLDEFIKRSIVKCTTDKIANLNPIVDIRQHYPDKSQNKNKPKDTIYRRSIVAIDIDSSFQVRKGLDIFQTTSPNQLRYDNEYFIRLNCSNTEKERSEAILKRKKFEVDKIFYN